MKKIGLILCLIFVLLGNINAETSKDIMIKYEYTDNISKQTKEIVDGKVEYQLNEDKIKIFLNASKGTNIIFFEVNTESLEWLKSKTQINEDANVYYLKLLSENKDIDTVSGISIEECSEENKVITVYDQNGNKIEKVESDCYIVIEKAEKNEDVNVYKDVIEIIKGEETSRGPLIIFVILLTIIFIILLVIVKTRKDKENE